MMALTKRQVSGSTSTAVSAFPPLALGRSLNLADIINIYYFFLHNLLVLRIIKRENYNTSHAILTIKTSANIFGKWFCHTPASAKCKLNENHKHIHNFRCSVLISFHCIITAARVVRFVVFKVAF